LLLLLFLTLVGLVTLSEVDLRGAIPGAPIIESLNRLRLLCRHAAGDTVFWPCPGCLSVGAVEHAYRQGAHYDKSET
jgi:hypothetical protein